MKQIITWFLCLTFFASANPVLIKIKPQDGLDVASLIQQNFQLVAELPDFYLVQMDEADINRLQGLTKSVQVLEIPKDKHLLYLFTKNGFDARELRRFGSILSTDEQGVLLATDEPSLIYINSLPVELVRISLEPLKIYPEPPLPSPLMVSESLVGELVSRVNPESILAQIRRLQNFYTRYSTTDSCRAAVEWMRVKLIEYGCDSTALQTHRPGYAPNVIGIKKGKINPRQIYCICGHIDNTSNYPPDRCPGSDDNASGTTAVLEAARVFQGIEFDYSVYFIGFTGEEQGLLGSEYYAQQARARGESIAGVLNFDMISYGREYRDSLDVIGRTINPNCAWLVDSFIASARTYTTLKARRRLVNPGQSEYSDHASFWHQGYVAFCGIERDFTPMYHTIGDTIGPLYYDSCGTNNWLLSTEAVKAAVATIAKLAGAQTQIGVKEKPGDGLRLTVTPSLGRPPFYLTSAVAQEIAVFDPLGQKITSLKLPALWEGSSQSGARVKPGVYLLYSKPDHPAPAAKLIITP
ncbi:MAG: M28 family metallopeptidase [bacterium]